MSRLLLPTTRKLNVVKPSLASLITAIKYLFYISSSVVSGLGLLVILYRAFPEVKQQPFSVQVFLLIGLSLIGVVILSTSTFSNIRNKFNNLETWIFSLCSKSNYFPQKNIRCLMIPDFYKFPLIEHQEQTGAIKEIIKSIERKTDIPYAIISGPSGSGKTKTVARLVTDIVSMKRGIQPKSFLYYDFNDIEDQKSLYIDTGSSLRKEAIVFIDNFHASSSDSILFLTNYLSKGELDEIFFVILCQPIDFWRVNPSDRVEIITRCEEEKQLFELTGIKSEKVRNFLKTSLFKDSIYKENDFYLLNTEESATSIAFLNSVYMFPTGSRDPRTSLFNILNSRNEKNKKMDRILIIRISIVISMSLYRGFFTKKDFMKILWFCVQEYPLIKRIEIIISSLLWLEKMKKTGIFPTLSTSYKRYVFHEKVAEEWKDKLSKDPGTKTYFNKFFTQSVLFQLDNFNLCSDIKWLLAVESGLTDSIVSNASSVMFVTNFNRMIGCIERNRYSLERHECVRLQYGTLLDKVGRFYEARETLSKVVNEEDPNNEFFIRLSLARIEAEHGPESQRLIPILYRSEFESVRISANYWKAHIDAHHGIFSSKKMKFLLDQFQVFLGQDIKNIGYSEVYLLSRIIFDGCRHSYLEGDNIKSKIEYFIRSPAINILKELDPQFSAYKDLYMRSHWLAHEYLYRYALRGEEIKDVDFPSTISPSEVEYESLNSLCLFIRDQYKNTQKMFSSVGGREARYLSADILNLDIICGDISDEDVDKRLLAYSRLIENSGFLDIASYPHFYYFKWNVIKFYDEFIFGAHDRAGIYLPQAEKSINKVIELDKSCKNYYGVWRAHFLKKLFLVQTNKSYRTGHAWLTDLKKLKSIAREKGYSRDINLIDGLIEGDSLPTPANLRAFFMYYPFVHQ